MYIKSTFNNFDFKMVIPSNSQYSLSYGVDQAPFN